MHQIGSSRFLLEGMQPLQKFGRIGVITELFDCRDLGTDWNDVAKNFDFRRAALNGGTASSGRLKSNKDDQGSGIGQALREMMLNASSCHHSTGGNNNAGIAAVIDFLGFLGRLRKSKSR